MQKQGCLAFAEAGKSTAPRQRIDYLDLLKGITMFGVVWLHSQMHPSWLTGILVNTIFFILSGMFFSRRSSFKSFIANKINRLIIPFVFFYVLGYIFQIILHYWTFRSMTNFNWYITTGIFNVNTVENLVVDSQLWFLLALFWMQIAYYFILRLNIYLRLGIVALIILLEPLISVTPFPCMLGMSIIYFPYFIIGNCFKDRMLAWLMTLRGRALVFIVSATLCIIVCKTLGYSLLHDTLGEHFMYVANCLDLIKRSACFYMMISVLVWFDNKPWLQPLRWISLNTVPMLGLHIITQVVFARLFFKLFHNITYFTTFTYSVLSVIACYAIISFIAPRWPRLFGLPNPHPNPQPLKN